MKEYFEKIIFPYFEEKRSELKLGNDQPALLIFDNFKGTVHFSFTMPS